MSDERWIRAKDGESETWPKIGQYIEYVIYLNGNVEANGVGMIDYDAGDNMLAIELENWLFGKGDVWKPASRAQYLAVVRAEKEELEARLEELSDVVERLGRQR
jgi:hypothetical protein